MNEDEKHLFLLDKGINERSEKCNACYVHGPEAHLL